MTLCFQVTGAQYTVLPQNSTTTSLLSFQSCRPGLKCCFVTAMCTMSISPGGLQIIYKSISVFRWLDIIPTNLSKSLEAVVE